MMQLVIRDQFESALNDGLFSKPGRREGSAFRTAAQTGPVSGQLGGDSVREELDIFRLGSCRTDRTAINPGGLYPDKELAVKAVIPGKQRFIEIVHRFNRAMSPFFGHAHESVLE